MIWHHQKFNEISCSLPPHSVYHLLHIKRPPLISSSILFSLLSPFRELVYVHTVVRLVRRTLMEWTWLTEQWLTISEHSPLLYQMVANQIMWAGGEWCHHQDCLYDHEKLVHCTLSHDLSCNAHFSMHQVDNAYLAERQLSTRTRRPCDEH